MKFKTKTKDLKEVVLSVSRAVDVKPSTPSLQGLYIKVEDGSCEVVGSDLDLVIKANLMLTQWLMESVWLMQEFYLKW